MNRIAGIISSIILIVLLTSCGSVRQPNNSAQAQSQSHPAVTEATAAPTAVPPAAETATNNVILTEEDAKNIALTDAGVTEADVTGIRIHLESDHGVQAYEVEFYAGNLEYDYDIDAATGQIRSKDTDIEDDFQTIPPTYDFKSVLHSD